MCGICGWVELRPNTRMEPSTLETMNMTLAHRGPDSTGAVVCGSAALAMSRLSIIDLVGGQQPLWNEDNSCCMFSNSSPSACFQRRSKRTRASVSRSFTARQQMCPGGVPKPVATMSKLTRKILFFASRIHPSDGVDG
jgi:hypothetical protein